jgi:murein DD-endopeptidase MepM/ murein hydrolase activator NlpD
MRPLNVTQGFGPNSWSTGAGAWMYGYAKQYGASGHPGVDFGMPVGTKVYAPVGGTVIRAGGTGGFTHGTGDRPGTGELRIQLDNGDQLILGHLSQINARIGQRISPGQLVALSGKYVRDKIGHTHVEYRRKVAPGTTPSGYKAVDPRTIFNGKTLSPLATAHHAGDGHDHSREGMQAAKQYHLGRGIQAARAAAAAANTSQFAKLVYDPSFLKSYLNR